MAESEQTIQNKLNGLAKAILEEQEGGVHQRRMRTHIEEYHEQPPKATSVLSGGHKTNLSSLFRRDMQTKMVVDSPRSECVPCPKK